MTTVYILASVAHGASLDLLEVGGAYGTPGATNPTAVWWNPAGLALAGGTQVYAEAAPTFGFVHVRRDEPDYAPIVLTPDMEAAGFPGDVRDGGPETFRSTAVVPFLGVSSDLGVDRLGLGLAVFVPTGRASTSTDPMGPNRYAIRQGSILAPRVSLGAAYHLADRLAIGASGSVVRSSFYADSDVSTYPDVAAIQRRYNGNVRPASFQEGYLEVPDYAAALVLGGLDGDGGHGALTDTAYTFGAGVYWTPKGDHVSVSLSWNHGFSVTNTGTATFDFGCPPAYDTLAVAAAEDSGLCNSVVPADVTVSYRLPHRVHLGVVVRPAPAVRLEAMGAWVGWGVFDDYAVELDVDPADIDSPLGVVGASETATLLSQSRRQARGNRDSFWVGVDGKVDVAPQVTAGGRITFDRSAVPTELVSANNLDVDTLLLQASCQVRPTDTLAFGLSYTYALAAERVVTNSVFAQDLDRAEPDHPEYYLSDDAVNRTFYPSANGSYDLAIHRIGVNVLLSFGGHSD